MKRAEIVVEMDATTADRARTTRAIADRSGVRSYSIEVTSTIGSADERPKVMRLRIPFADAERTVSDIQQMPGVLNARIGVVDDWPPDDDPPAGVREPRRPLPPTGHQSQAIDEP